MKGGKSKAETKKADIKLSIKKKETKPKPKPTKNEKAGKDPNKPKPPSAFFVFMEEFRKTYKEKFLNVNKVAVMIGSLTVFHQLMNFYRLQDFQTDLSRKFRTFRILTPTCNYVYIVEPANVEYILKTNFSNYGKVFSAFGFVHKITTFEKTAGFQICGEFVHAWIGAQVKVPTKFIVGDLDLTYHYPGIQDCSSISNSRASSLTSGRQSMRGNEHVAPSYTFQGQMSSSSLLPQQGRQQMFSSGSREYDNAQHQSSYSNPAPDAQYGSMKRE